MTKPRSLAPDKVVDKKDPKPCARCGMLTRHRCRACSAIQCAVCLNMADRCPACAGGSSE